MQRHFSAPVDIAWSSAATGSSAAPRRYPLHCSVVPKGPSTTPDPHDRYIQSLELEGQAALPPSRSQKPVWIRVSLWSKEIKYT